MIKKSQSIPSFDDIVFMDRNKNYGAYLLRKRYPNTVFISLLTGVLIMTTVIIIPFIRANSPAETRYYHERQVEIKMENLIEPNEIIAPPPPPPSTEIIQQTRYIAPVIVDSVSSQEALQLMSADDAIANIDNEKVVEDVQEVKEELKEVELEAEPEPFFAVEEMPEPQGGLPGLYKHISENLVYPEQAHENNIQGKVFVRFCVTSTGNIEKISIYKGVDPELDAEAIRVISTLPTFKPGKQFGRPVPVWFTLPINFELN